MEYGDFYDRMIDWSKRLAREGPKLLALAEEAKARQVLDAACGTGEHALYLQGKGLSVIGVDISQQAIEQARDKGAARQLPVDFRTGTLEDLAALTVVPQDMVICIGNSLPHLLSRQALAGAFQGIHQRLRPGGALLLQVRNYHKVMGGQERFMPLNWSKEGERDHLFLRMMDFLPDGNLDFNILHFVQEGGGWRMERQVERLRPIFREELEQLLTEAGFSVDFWGDYDKTPFDPAVSPDLIAWAIKSDGN